MTTRPIARMVVVSAQTSGILLTQMALCVVLLGAALVLVWMRKSIHHPAQLKSISISKFPGAGDLEAAATSLLQIAVHRVHANDEKIR